MPSCVSSGCGVTTGICFVGLLISLVCTVVWHPEPPVLCKAHRRIHAMASWMHRWLGQAGGHGAQ